MNQDTIREVHKNDLPQRVRNTLAAQQDDDVRDLTRLKVEINNFCWMYLPGDKTLREAELIACQIFRVMSGQDLGLSSQDEKEKPCETSH